MKFLGVFTALFVLVAPVFVIDGVSAQTPKFNNQLKVTGIVLPAQHVIVDNQGVITGILSNTDNDVMPKVYAYRLSKENQRRLTPEIYRQYRELVPKGKSRVGILYERPAGIQTGLPIRSLRETNFESTVFSETGLNVHGLQ